MGSEGERAHFRDATALLNYGFETLRIIPMVTSGVRFEPLSAEERAALEAQALFESLLHVAAISRVGSVEELAVVEEPSSVALNESQLPGLGDAFRWFLGVFR
jgi:hypothetical protein